MDNQNERKPSTNGYEYDCESFPPASREYYEAVLPAHLKGLAANLAGKENVKVQDKDQGKD